jgi:hypothetical protein
MLKIEVDAIRSNRIALTTAGDERPQRGRNGYTGAACLTMLPARFPGCLQAAQI